MPAPGSESFMVRDLLNGRYKVPSICPTCDAPQFPDGTVDLSLNLSTRAFLSEHLEIVDYSSTADDFLYAYVKDVCCSSCGCVLELEEVS